MDSPERAEALPIHPWPCSQARAQAPPISTHQWAVMELPGLAGPLASLRGPVQTGPELPAHHSKGSPSSPRGKQPHPGLCLFYSNPPRVCLCRSVQGVNGCPFLCHTQRMQVAVGPLSSLHLPSTAGDTHAQDAICGHTQRLMHERAHTHAHGGPQSPTSVTLRQHLEHGRCQSCHWVCLWQGSTCDC